MKTKSIYDYKDNLVLRHLGISNPELLGKGNEGRVYAYNYDVLKIYFKGQDLNYLKDVKEFLSLLSSKGFSFETPKIFEIGQVDDVVYTIEKKLKGAQMDKKIVDLSTKDRQKVYSSYYDAIKEFHSVSFPKFPYGHIINRKSSVTSSSWTSFLIEVVEQKITKTHSSLSKLVPGLNEKVQLFKSYVLKYLNCNKKQLVFGDYYLNNVLVDNNLKVSALLDINAHATVGDPRMDISAVLRWNEIDQNVKKDDYQFLTMLAKKDFGGDIEDISDLYLLFSSFYFSDMDDSSFSVKHLNDQKIWRKFQK